MKVPGLVHCDAGPVLSDHLHPAGWVDLHQDIGDEYDVHAVNTLTNQNPPSLLKSSSQTMILPSACGGEGVT